MDERQERGATDSYLPATEYVRRLRRTVSQRNKCFAAKLEVPFRILAGSSA